MASEDMPGDDKNRAQAPGAAGGGKVAGAQPPGAGGGNVAGAQPPPGFWQCMHWLSNIFSTTRNGHDVPIAIAIILAVVPFYLLWQQNNLSFRQEQILRVQTRAGALSTSRQITIDINHADGARNSLSAMVSAYGLIKDTSVTVSFYMPTPPSTDAQPNSISLPVKDFFPQPCTANITAIDPVKNFNATACQESNPIQVLRQESGFVFNPDGLGRIALSVVNYLKLIADTQQASLTGIGADRSNLADILRDAIEACNLNSAKNKLGDDPNHMLGLARTMMNIEASAQSLGNVYASEYQNLSPNSVEISAKKNTLLDSLGGAINLLLISKNDNKQVTSHLQEINQVISDKYVSLEKFIKKANEECNTFVTQKYKERENIVLSTE